MIKKNVTARLKRSNQRKETLRFINSMKLFEVQFRSYRCKNSLDKAKLITFVMHFY